MDGSSRDRTAWPRPAQAVRRGSPKEINEKQYCSGISATTGTPVTVTPPGSTWYHAAVTDTFGCSARDSIFVQVDSLGLNFAIVPGDTTICYGGHLALGTSNPAGSYLWSLGDTTATVSLTGLATTVITVAAFSPWGRNGCTALDTITVTVDSFALTAAFNAPVQNICVGGPAQLSAPPALSHAWSAFPGPGNPPGIPNPVVSPPVTTQYTVLMTNAQGCAATGYAVVDVDNTFPPALVLTPDTTVCTGTPATLRGTGGGTYSWSPGQAMNDSTLAGPTLSVAATTTYTMTVSDGGACTGRDTVRVTVVPCCTVPGVTTYIRPRTSALPFSAVPATGGAVHIVDTLFVDNTPVSYANKTFWMDSMAVIHIMPGCTLNTTNCTFRAACAQMWDGLHLRGTNTRHASAGDTIQNATNGIRSVDGGVFAVNGSTFRANHAGIRAENFTAGPHPGSVRAAKFRDGPLLPPHPPGTRGFAGIAALNVRELTIGFPDNNAATENLFEGMRYGIHAKGSGLNVWHNRFLNIVPPIAAANQLAPGDYSAVWATANVQAFASPDLVAGHKTSTQGGLLGKHGNAFINCQDGVFSDGRINTYVRGNSMDAMPGYGVFVRRQAGNFLRVEHNTFSQNRIAIFAGNSLNVSGLLGSNRVTGDTAAFRVAIRMDVISYGALAAGSYPMQVRDNNIDLTGNGIFMNVCAGVNVENNRVRVLRTITKEFNFAIYANSSSRMRIANNPDVSSGGLGATTVKTAGVYVANSPQTSVTCNTIRDVGCCAVVEGICTPGDFLGNTMRNGVDGFVMLNQGEIGLQGRDVVLIPYSPAVPSDNKWTGTFSNSWTNAVSSVGNNSQFFVRPNGPFNPPANMNKAVGAAAVMTPISVGNGNLIPVACYSTLPAYETGGGIKDVATRINGNGTSQANRFRADEWAFGTLIREPALISSDSAIQAYHAACSGTSLAATCEANERLNMPDSALAAQATQQILPLSLSEVNHKAVLNIRLAGPELDQGEIQQLIAIAGQCEAIGGRAVNIARGLLAAEGILFWEDPGCQTGLKTDAPDLGGDGLAAAVSAECWPNPGSGRIFVRFSEPGLSGWLSAWDASGRELGRWPFDFGGQPLELDAGGWAQGLLTVRAELANGTWFSWRVIVQR
jgi:hypothetical protein